MPSPSTPTYSVASSYHSKTSLSPACFFDHTFNASDVNRKVTETLLLKELASHPAARLNNLSPLLLPQAKSTQQATCSALASLCDATNDNVVKAASLYALCLYLSNRSKPQPEGTIRKITPIVVNAALTSSPKHSREEIEVQMEREGRLAANSSYSKHKRRICGWISEAPWGGDWKMNDTVSTVKPGSLSLDNPLAENPSIKEEDLGDGTKEMSSLTEAIHRVEGSALAVLKILREGKGGDLAGIEEGEVEPSDAGDLIVVKAGGSTVVSTTVGNNDDLANSKDNSVMAEIVAAGEKNNNGVVQRAGSDADDSTVQSEMTMYDDLKPLSLTSIRRAGVAALACVVASIYNVSDPKNRSGPIKAFVAQGGIDALIVGSFYEWRDYYDPNHGSSVSLQISNMPNMGGGKDDHGMESARSSISSHSNTSFSSSVIYTTIADSAQEQNQHPSVLQPSDSTGKRNKEEANAYLLYQQNRRDQKTADTIEKLNDKSIPRHQLFRIFNGKDSKHVKDNTQIMSEALGLVKSDDLKRVTIARTSTLRRFLSSTHPTTWSFSPLSGHTDFFVTPPSSQPHENITRPSGGLFWMVERPLSELYENKIRKKLEFHKKMEDAKVMQKVAKGKKKDYSLDLRRRLKAASEEASSEIMRKNLQDERKMLKLQKKMDEANKKNKLKLMADLARSTEILVASLKSDGVDVEDYFREQEIEERREAWMRKFGDLKPVSEPSSVRSHPTTQEENDDDDAMRMESELERRVRLRREERERREWYENTLEEREEMEIKRVHFIKTQDRESMKVGERKKKVDDREGKDWVLKRRQDLILSEHRGKKKVENEEKERKRVFNKYLVKLQNKVARERKEKDAAWKKREAAEEKVRQAWSEEAEVERKAEEEEQERLRVIDDAKEKARLEVLEAAKAEKQKVRKEKQDKFKAEKALVLARLSGSTWVNKGGENKYYDAVGWKEKVDVVRDEMKEVLGDDESFVDSGGNYEANSTSEAQDDESQNDAQSLKADDSVVSEITSLKSEWIDVEVEGKKMLQNIVTQEFKEAN